MAKQVEKTEWGWAIAGRFGLYVGWQQTRVAAIAQHTYDLDGGSQFALSGKLSAEQSKIWNKCRREGDRAVRVTLNYWA